MSRNRVSVLAAAAVLASACSAQPSEEPSSAMRELIGPDVWYADAARYGDLVWTAGHLPLDLSPLATIEEQTEEVLDSLEATLEEAGAGFDTLIKTNVYLLDFNDWDAFNAIYVERIGQYGTPPRSTVEVGELGGGYRIEIEMVAHVRASAP